MRSGVLAQRRGGQRGQAMGEFALSCGVLFAVVFGLIVCARALFLYDLVANAARQGARWAMVRGTGCAVSGCPATTASVKSYVLSKSPGVDSTKMTVTTTWSTAPGCTDPNHQGRLCLVTVAVSYPFRFSYPMKLSITMSSSSQMVMSQ